MDRVCFRRIVKEDREEIRRILLDVANFTEEEVSVALSLVDEYFEGDDDYNFVVATFEDQVIGYACYGPTPLTRGTWDIYWIAVLKEFQRKNVGSSLIKEVEKEIREKGGRLILIETSSKESYNQAIRFYERMNYSLIGRIGKFYSEHDDKLIYGKYL